MSLAMLPLRTRSRYTARVLALARVLLCCTLALLPVARAFAEGTGDIAQETLRTHRGHKRIVNFWWFPPEYWVASARELGKPASEIATVRALFRRYILLGALDVEVKPDGSIDALSTAEIVRRMEVLVNGDAFDPLREVEPKLQDYATELSYVLQTSLAVLAPGLRVLPLPNLNAEGEPIVNGSKPGRITVVYQASAGEAPAEFHWRAPLTSVAGAQRCPKGGEPLEASWSYCPWHGVRISPDSPAAGP